jgi:hypothetical protein
MVGASQLALARGEVKRTQLAVRQDEDALAKLPPVAKPLVRAPIDVRGILRDALSHEPQPFERLPLLDPRQDVR